VSQNVIHCTRKTKKNCEWLGICPKRHWGS